MKTLILMFLLFIPSAYALQTCGFISGTYYCLSAIDATAINWTSLNAVIQSNAINWQDPNGVVIGRAVNWSNINGIAKINNGGVNWLDFKALDASFGSHSGINWQSLGV